MLERAWAGVDIGKGHHHAVVVDTEGRRVLSRRVSNDETALLELISAGACSGACRAGWRIRRGHSLGPRPDLANLLVTRRQAREAHDWYRRAAELGSSDAMGNLANLLYEAQHIDDAERWWRLAGEADNTDAMYNLAVMLDKSFHFDEAITWYRRAAEAGHTDAMHNLAIRLRYRGQNSEATTWWHSAGQARATHQR